MARLATGVVVVTCWIDGKPWGTTVSACCSVSLDPPLILASLRENTASVQAIRRSGTFGISILGQRTVDVARFASRPGQAKFIHEYCDVVPDTVTPAIRDSVAHACCEVDQQVRAGDHVLFVGRVREVFLHTNDRPLVYHSRDFCGIGQGAPSDS
ncbi:flavin reductase family protein [Pseudonocardia sp. H11422]|uniref:flavin reductase family protein n=1 Tax=Pseudonocardia sp. H11422 TaxID=2835866 RepID=UPI001BDDB84D|nr:flavin reductase family protein [Pseudonocardia sp. H11422]